MPESLAQKIRDAQGMPGERKQVTVLFCDLAGSTAVAGGLDPEVYREVLDQYIALAMHEIYRLEGIVNQLSGDGFMALFGAPVAHEDAPQRAVLAALAIRDALAHFNEQLQRERGVALPARIGLNTGPVVVGTVGNDLKMDYTAIGDTTNLAARLEQLATPGTILISETTARLVRGFARLRQVGPLDVKGKAEPVTAYEVLDGREQANPDVGGGGARAHAVRRPRRGAGPARSLLPPRQRALHPGGESGRRRRQRQVARHLRVQAAAAGGGRGRLLLRGTVRRAQSVDSARPVRRHAAAVLRPVRGRRRGQRLPQGGGAPR